MHNPSSICLKSHRTNCGKSWRVLPLTLWCLFAVGHSILFSTEPQAGPEGMQYPLAVAATGEDVYFVADRNLPGIWKIEQGRLSVYYQGSKKFRTPLNAVRCLAIDAQGNLFAGDSATREVYRFDKQGKPQPLTQGDVGIPTAIVIDPNNQVVVADLELHRLVRILDNGTVEELAKVDAPRGLGLDKDHRYWVLSHGKAPLIRFDKDQKAEPLFNGVRFQFGHHIAFDPKGNLYVSDGYAKTIWRISPEGRQESLIQGDPLKNPVGLTYHRNRLIVADPHQKMVYEVNLEGTPHLQPILKP